MYKKFGYVVFRRVLNYYSGSENSEDAFGRAFVVGHDENDADLGYLDMRKALPRDIDKRSLVAKKAVIRPDEMWD